MSEHYLKLLPQIKVLLFDIDGVLTDGSLILSPDGEVLRSMNAKDGFALKHAAAKGLYTGAITRGTTAWLPERLKRLGMQDVVLNAQDKYDAFETLLFSYGWKKEEVLYMGDDLPDLAILNEVGIAACPADAAHEVREVCKYISPFEGGKGCVRDIIEKVMRVQEIW
jgi:3-deoxy-D-manno-octulosonate 8-phosphate phosphatase (KDO 8-P phosphatase)